MRTLLILLLTAFPVFAWTGGGAPGTRSLNPSSCQATVLNPALFNYEIKSIDPAGNFFTAYAADQRVVTFQIRPDTQFTVNGQEMHFKDLQPEMRVKITLADPGVAAVVDAIGKAAPLGAVPAGGTAEGPLTKALEQTRWTWEVGSAISAYVQFLPGGVFNYTDLSVNKTYHWTWASTGGFDVLITTGRHKTTIIRFDPDITRFTKEGEAPSAPDRLVGHPIKPGDAKPH